MRSFLSFTMIMLSASAIVCCRQLLSIDELPVSAVEKDGSVADAGSPFSVVNGQPQGETLYGIWGTGPEFFVAVGTSSVSFVYRKGLMTRLGGTSLGRDYSAVWGTSTTDVYAVGRSPSGGFVDHFDGEGWLEVYHSNTALLGVWGVTEGTGAVFAVGIEGKIFGTKPGSPWSVIETIPKVNPTDEEKPSLWSISGRNVDDFTIAAGTQLFHWEPAAGGIVYYEPMRSDMLIRFAWQIPGPTTSVLLGTNHYGIIWFSGSGGEGPAGDAGPISYKITNLIHDEASPGAADAFMEGAWGTSEKIIAVGDHGRIYACNTGTMDVKTIASPTDESLGGVWGSSLDDVWIVGRRELILHGSIR